MTEKVDDTVGFLKGNGFGDANLGIVLGTGLGKLLQFVEIEIEQDYGQIPNFPLSTVEFHKGKLIQGTLSGKRLIIMQGRFHLYEGYTLKEVSFPIRVLKEIGINNLILLNAAGAIDLSYSKGDIMIVEDHINLMPGSPLLGKNIDEYGIRFPDMSQAYSAKINELVLKVARKKNISIGSGVYAAVSGPNLETRAEYRFLKTIGANAVGMSTVPEVIVANHMGLACAAISILTDICDPDNLEKIEILDIIRAAEQGEEKLLQILPELIDLL